MIKITMVGVLLLVGLCVVLVDKFASMPSYASEEASFFHRQVPFTQIVFADKRRLSAIAWRMHVANVGLCDESIWSFGMETSSLFDVPKPLRSIWREAVGIRDRLTVWFVAEDSPAARAGLARGDRLRMFDGKDIPSGSPRVSAMFRTFRARSVPPREYALVVRGKEEEERKLFLRPVRICKYGAASLSEESKVAAFMNGIEVLVAGGMMRVVRDDDALALIFGHEMAHNVHRHLLQEPERRPRGGKSIAESSVPYFSQALEEEADYHGVYFAARAGYDVRKGLDILRDVAAKYPDAIDLEYAHTHTSSVRRLLLLEAAVAEVERKKAENKPLRPEETP